MEPDEFLERQFGPVIIGLAQQPEGISVLFLHRALGQDAGDVP